MSNGTGASQARVLDAFGDPTRRAVLELLRGGERSVRELTDATEVSQPAVSQHLRVLRERGARHGPGPGHPPAATGSTSAVSRGCGPGSTASGTTPSRPSSSTPRARPGRDRHGIPPAGAACGHVARPVDEAFAVFTDRIGAWWPLPTHGVFGRMPVGWPSRTASSSSGPPTAARRCGARSCGGTRRTGSCSPGTRAATRTTPPRSRCGSRQPTAGAPGSSWSTGVGAVRGGAVRAAAVRRPRRAGPRPRPLRRRRRAPSRCGRRHRARRGPTTRSSPRRPGRLRPPPPGEWDAAAGRRARRPERPRDDGGGAGPGPGAHRRRVRRTSSARTPRCSPPSSPRRVTSRRSSPAAGRSRRRDRGGPAPGPDQLATPVHCRLFHDGEVVLDATRCRGAASRSTPRRPRT